MSVALIVEAPAGIGSGDIELLRNMGVAGIVVDLDGPADLERVAEVKRGIDALPRRRPRNGRSIHTDGMARRRAGSRPGR